MKSIFRPSAPYPSAPTILRTSSASSARYAGFDGSTATGRPAAFRTSDAGAEVEVVERVAEGAFAALRGAQPERHDALVRDAFESLAGDVDVVVLAQASMARAVDAIPADVRRTPVLSSPRLGVERAGELLGLSPAPAG